MQVTSTAECPSADKSARGLISNENFVSNSSYTEIRVKPVKHQWTVKNFSHCNQEYLESFISFNHSDTIFKWSVKIYPRGNGESNKDYVFLCLNHVAQQHGVFMKNSFKASFSLQNVHGERIDMRVHPSPNHSDYVTYAKRDAILPKIHPQDVLMVTTMIHVVIDTVTESANVAALQTPDSKNIFVNDMDALYEKGTYTDFSICVGGTIIRTHRCILAARSKVFAAMLVHGTEESRKRTLEISDFEPDVIQELIHFIYTGYSNRIDELGADLLTAADKYNLEDLKLHCEKALVRAINTQNACALLALADSHMASSLYRACVEYIRQNINDVTDSPGWQTLVRDYPNLITELFRQLDAIRIP
uniref:BTB domain-containing protein n=1 Tax=Trichuris muris TaxID=70415 RepID=A0A5S6QEG8_TRIMR